MTATKTNIDLIVDGTKVRTRRTTGRPYTHALVTHSGGKWAFLSCSSKGPQALQRIIDEARELHQYRLDYLAKNPSDERGYRPYAEAHERTTYLILPIVENAVTVTFSTWVRNRITA